MGETVLLLHTLADGSWHYDWMLERPDPAARLLTFRVARRIHEAASHGFEAERIADHRRMYLEYEGEISGGRGEVERVARGSCEILDEGPSRLFARLAFGALSGEWVGVLTSGSMWRFEMSGS